MIQTIAPSKTQSCQNTVLVNVDGKMYEATARRLDSLAAAPTGSSVLSLPVHPDITTLPTNYNTRDPYRTVHNRVKRGASNPEVLTEYTNVMAATDADVVFEETRDNVVQTEKRFSVLDEEKFEPSVTDWMTFYGDVQGRRDRAVLSGNSVSGQHAAQRMLGHEVADSTPLSSLGIRSRSAKNFKAGRLADTNPDGGHVQRGVKMRNRGHMRAGHIGQASSLDVHASTARIDTRKHKSMRANGLQVTGVSVDEYNTMLAHSDTNRALPTLVNRTLDAAQDVDTSSDSRAVLPNDLTLPTLVNSVPVPESTQEEAVTSTLTVAQQRQPRDQLAMLRGL